MIETDTRITYPDGATSASGTIVHVEKLDGGMQGVVLDRTAAHPVDPTWPDQGPDTGTLAVDASSLPLVDVRIGAWDGQELRLSDSLPARLGSDGWNFVVVHVVPAGHPLEIGANAIVEVDEKHRYGLSSGHTACHLAALALNDALAVHWSKDVRRDSLGTPDFDGAAIQRSTIRPYGAADTYRLGKSLRKSGFGADDALARLPEIEERVNTRLAEWIGADSPVHIRRASDLLSERRFWVCALPDATATIPCGGTHITNLAELRAATIQLTIDDSRSTLTMTTSVAATD